IRSDNNVSLAIEMSSPAATTLPHLKGARPTIHAGLLRPVLLNRERTAGHPGAPPPAPASKKRRKYQKNHQHRCVAEGLNPQTPTSSGTQKDLRIKSRQGSGGQATGQAQNIRCKNQNRQGRHSSGEACPSVSPITIPFGGDRPLCPVDPGSHNCTRASSASPSLECHDRHSEPKRTRGSVSLAKHAPQGRGDHNVQSQTKIAVDPEKIAFVAATGGKRRASLLRFRPATRQELKRSANRRQTTTERTGTPTPGVGKSTQLRSLEHDQLPKALRGRRKSRHVGDAGGRNRFVESHPPQKLLRNLEFADDEPRRSSGTPGAFGSCIPPGTPGVGEQEKEGSSVFEAASGHPSAVDESTSSSLAPRSAGRPVRHERFGAEVHAGLQQRNDNRGHRGGQGNSGGDVNGGSSRGPSSLSPVDTTSFHVATCMCELCRRGRAKRILGAQAWPTFKFVGVEPRLVSATLQAQRFRRHPWGRASCVGDKASWRLLWSSQHLRSHVFRNLKRGQRINSFPRTYECTRKDALSRNMNRMSEVHGARHFSFAPRGFVLPAEREALREAMLNTSEGETWIVKPASSACGRGIYITKNFADMPVGTGADGNWIAQRYVEDPMLLDGLKFDLRLYVAVTSFRPLRVYLHDEGLCRLATEFYRPDPPSFGNKFIHLTNYSINRRSNRYEHGKTTGADELQQSETSAGTALSQNQSPERAHHGAGCVFFTPPHRPSDGATTDIASEEANGFPGSAASKGCPATPTTVPAGGGTRGCSPNLSTGEGKCGNEGKSAVSIDVTKPTTVKGRTCTGKKESGGSSAGGRRVGGGMGSKWSLKVLRRRLAGMGVDVPALWQDIHSVVIKTLIAIEAQVSAAVELLAIRRGTCFEMFGFDVLVDRQQRPHLLEVNFAPSLNTDSDLDLEIKSKVVADLLNLAGIRGPLERPHSPAADATGNNTSNGSARRRRGGMHRRGKAQAPGTQGTEEVIEGGGKGDGGGCRTNNDNSGDESEVGDGSTVDGNAVATPLGNNKARGTPCRAKQAGAAGACVLSGAPDGVESLDQATRPTTTKERGKPTSRSTNRQRHTGGNGGDGGIGGGNGDRAAPAWEGSFRAGDGGAPSTEEMSAVVAESERELGRSGGFELIFPVARTANKYLKFFDGPRPFERLLAAASAARSPHKGTREARGKAALKGMRYGRDSRKNGGRKGGDAREHRHRVAQ
ncbi:unnamed protein product, partial [Ectocarpus sp. 13 AM-2016]